MNHFNTRHLVSQTKLYFFDNLEKKLERSQFQLIMTGMGVSYHQKKVWTCRGWGNIFGGVIENGDNEPKFCLKVYRVWYQMKEN